MHAEMMGFIMHIANCVSGILIGGFPANQWCCMDEVIFFSKNFQMIFEAPDVGRDINVLIVKDKPDNVFIIMGFLSQ